MEKITNWENIQEAGTYANLKPGWYICKIKSVKDVFEKNYLELHFDIEEGEFKNYFSILEQSIGKDKGIVYKSYQEKALPFFKAMITAFEKSNPNYKWDWNEQSLVGKQVVIVFREEDYLDQSNEIRTRVKADEFHSIEVAQKGEIKLKPKKELSEEEKQKFIDAHRDTLGSKSNNVEPYEDNLPF